MIKIEYFVTKSMITSKINKTMTITIFFLTIFVYLIKYI